LMRMAIEPVYREHPADRFIRMWVTFMHGPGKVKPQGYPSRACGGVTNYTSMDLENVAAYENLDRTLAEKTDAVINGLPPIEQCAIYHKYLHAVYRFPRGNLDDVLERAKNAIQAGLQRRDVWIGD
jgi:hypothetical protein